MSSPSRWDREFESPFLQRRVSGERDLRECRPKGFERCLWGTDWTRAFAVVNYEQAVVPFLKSGRLSDSERAMLMGGACAKAYGWSPQPRRAQ